MNKVVFERYEAYKDSKAMIADGYHRLCAIYELDEDALIQCKII